MTEETKEKIIKYLNRQNDYGSYLYLEQKENSFLEPEQKESEINDLPDTYDPANDENITDYESLSVNPNWRDSKSIGELYDNIHTCLRCPLGTTRKHFVFGSGNINADIMVIGEAPGADEDEQGLPFVGRAGQLLTKIIESINFKREDIYICNICKCRPPGNRAPFASEVEACLPYLLKQIELVKPEFILALGATAVGSLTGKKPVMAEARGKITDFHGVKMLITYHPAALLYNPNLKRDVWEDMKLLKKLYLESKNNQIN